MIFLDHLQKPEDQICPPLPCYSKESCQNLWRDRIGFAALLLSFVKRYLGNKGRAPTGFYTQRC